MIYPSRVSHSIAMVIYTVTRVNCRKPHLNTIMILYGMLKRVRRSLLAILLVVSITTQSCTIDSSTLPLLSSANTTDSIHNVTPTSAQDDITIAGPQILNGSTEGIGIIGLIRNESKQDLAEIVIVVSVFDPEENIFAMQEISPILNHLNPSEESLYFAWFEGISGEIITDIEITHSENTSFEHASVEIDDISIFTTSDGVQAILGKVTNPSDEPLTLHDFGFLKVNSEDEMLDFAVSAAGPLTLAPGETLPILAVSHTQTPANDWEFYADATINTSLPPVELSFTRSPSLEFTNQGLPFVLGEIHNEAAYIRWVRLLIAAYHENQLLSCTVTKIPVPIHPGENRAFLESQLPGLLTNAESRGIDLDDIEIQAHIELNLSRGFDEIPVPLSIEIDRYQSVGSSLMLHGNITNSEEISIMQPTVLATVRTTTGELVSAGWSIVSDIMASAETLDFVLPLTLPRDADIVMSEFDLHAVGFYP